MPFLIFSLIFLIYIFLIKIGKKGIILTYRVTWRVAPAGALTWRAGPPRRCDAALRPRGRAQVARAGSSRRIMVRPRGRGPRDHAGSRGRPCGAPRGR